MITREFNLYLHAGHSIPLVINVNQYDRGEQWLFTLFNSDGTQYVPSSGAIVGIKSDNLGIINTGSVDAQGRIVINETQQMTAAVGKAVFELLIDDQTHGTANFVVLVEAKPGDNADLSETDISMIEQAIEAAANIKPYGSPLVASTVAGMTDHDKVYVYVGSETGYTSGNWYYWDGSAWTSGGVYNSVAVQTDTTLTLSGVAADSAKVGQELSDLKSEIEQSGGLTSVIKSALLQLAQKVAYIDDDGQTYYDDLYDALYPPVVYTAITLNTNSLSFGSLNATQTLVVTTIPSGGNVTWSSSNTSVATVSQTGVVTAVDYGNATITATCGSLTATCSVAITQATVTSISAVYAQGSKVVYTNDSLDSLKDDLTVTASWSNDTTSTVAKSDYTLSGTLTAGTSTITVEYASKTATFTVAVTAPDFTWMYRASDGQTLTQRSDIVTKNITAGSVTEELSDGLLHLIAPFGNNGCKWDFVQATNSNAELEIRFKPIQACTATAISGFQPQLSNGTNGAKFGLARQPEGTDVKAITGIGKTYTRHDITLNEWHTVKLVLSNGKQSVYLDGVALVENVNPVTEYCVNNRVFFQSTTATGGTATEVYIDWIKYLNKDNAL